MSLGISVAICCHNSARRLPETLRHLAKQKVPGGIPWEIIVIDNASTDDTAEIAKRNWPAKAPAPLRVVPEPEPGLSHARLRVIADAKYEIISFIDDDNWVLADWVARIHTVFLEHPEVGVCGGRSEAVCEIAPPFWFETVRDRYAVGPQHAQSGDITNAHGTLLWGAGLSLRTTAARKLLADGFTFLMSGRQGQRMLAGEDTELCFALRASGWYLWYDNDLVLRHFIPKERLQWAYVLRLLRGLGETSPLIDLYLIALNAFPFNTTPAWKKTWGFRVLKVFRDLARLVLLHPEDCIRKSEGSRHALAYQAKLGHLFALWNLRSQEPKLRDRIAQSAWVKSPEQPA